MAVPPSVQPPYVPLPSATAPRSQVIPALHLARFISTTSPLVCIIGDSTSTLGAANLVPTDLLWWNLVRRIREDNPAKTVSFFNGAVSGTTWGSFLNIVGANWPSWYAVHSLWWNSYIQAQGCDTLFVNWGVNDSLNLTALTVQQVLTNIVSWGTAPPAWQANHAYVLGNVVTDSNGRLQAVGSPGTSGATQPSWAGGLNFSTTDGSVVWILPKVATYVPKIPDIVLITNKVANPAAGAPYSQTNYQNGYLAAASFQRTLALSGYNFGLTGLPKLGLIDIGRFFNEAVNGFDPAEQYFAQTITTPITGLTASQYNLPQTGGDFDVTFTFPGTGVSAAGTVFEFILGTGDGSTAPGVINQLNVVPNSGTNLVMNYYPGAGTSPIQSVNSTAWSATGNNVIEISAQGGHLLVQANYATLIDANYPRYVSPFQPILYVLNPPAGFSYTLNSYNTATPRGYAPLITPVQCYGTTASTINGNGINHDTSACINLVDQHVVDATRFSASDP